MSPEVARPLEALTSIDDLLPLLVAVDGDVIVFPFAFERLLSVDPCAAMFALLPPLFPPPFPAAPPCPLPLEVSLDVFVRASPVEASPPDVRLLLALPATPTPTANPDEALVEVRPPSESDPWRLPPALPLPPPAPPTPPGCVSEAAPPVPPAPPVPDVSVFVLLAVVAPPVAAPVVAAPEVWVPGVEAPPVLVAVVAPVVAAPVVDAPPVVAPPVAAPPVPAPEVAVLEAAPPVWLTAPFDITAPIGLLIDSEFVAPAAAPPFVFVIDVPPMVAAPLVAVVLPELVIEPPVAAPPVAVPVVAAPPDAPLPPVAVAVVEPVLDCDGFLLLVLVLAFEFVVLFVAVLLPVVLDCPLDAGDVADESLPFSSASAWPETNNAETAKATTVLFMANLFVDVDSRNAADDKLPGVAAAAHCRIRSDHDRQRNRDSCRERILLEAIEDDRSPAL